MCWRYQISLFNLACPFYLCNMSPIFTTLAIFPSSVSQCFAKFLQIMFSKFCKYKFRRNKFRRNLYCFARFHKYFLCSFTVVSQGSQGFTNMSFASLQFSVSQEFANRFFVSQVSQGFAMGSLLMIILEQQMITLPALQLV